MASGSPKPPSGRAEKVLAVVNDLFFEAKIGEVLRTLGIPLAFAKSEEGLTRRLAEAAPALAIVDAGARGLDALAAIRRLRAEAPAAPVVAFVSHVNAELAARAREAGATEVLAKSELARRLPDLARTHAGRLASPPSP